MPARQITVRPHEQVIVDELIARAREAMDVRAVWLYGSRARGEEPREYSDVDLLFITGGDMHRDQATLFDFLGEISERDHIYAFVISPRAWSLEWLANRRWIDSFFLREVERDKVVMFGEAAL